MLVIYQCQNLLITPITNTFYYTYDYYQFYSLIFVNIKHVPNKVIIKYKSLKNFTYILN